MTRPLLALLLVAAASGTAVRAQDTLRVPLAAVPGPGPFAAPAGSAQSVGGIDLGPTGLADSLGAAVYDEPVWVPGADGFALVTWAVAEDADGTITVWVDADGDHDLAEEEPRTYPPLAIASGEDPRRAAAGANQAVAVDTLTVRHGGRAARVTFWPFLYAVDAGGAVLRGADGTREVFVQVGRHHRGRVEIDDAPFDVFLGVDAPRSVVPNEADVRVWVVPEGTTPVGEPYPVGGSFPAAGRTFQLLDVAPDASTLTLVASGAAPDTVGTRVGQTAPDFAAPTLAGDTLRLSSLRGRHVLLEFWGTWCAPCVAYAPELAALYERYPRSRFEIVGIAADESEAVRLFVAEHGLGWPQVVEPDGERAVIEQYEVRGFPTTVLVGPDGTVLYRGLGYGPSVKDQLAEALGE